MEHYSLKPADPSFEILGLTEDMVEEYNGFIEYLTSDDFTLWLVDVIGRKKVHIRNIVSALFNDEFISRDQSGGKRLPPELYDFLIVRVNELIEEALLIRGNRVNLLELRNKPSAPLVYNPKKVRETAPQTLDERIEAARIATPALHSHSINRKTDRRAS